MLTDAAPISKSEAHAQPSAFLRFLSLCAGMLGAGVLVGSASFVLRPLAGAVFGGAIALFVLLILFARQVHWVLRPLGATRLPLSPALRELWRRASLRLSELESAECGGRKVMARTRLPRLAVFDHAGPVVLVLRGWLPSQRWVVVSRDMLQRVDEEWLVRALMEAFRALDRSEVRYRTSLAGTASLLCRRVPTHLFDGPDPSTWAVSTPRVLLALAVLPFYSFLSAPGIPELSVGSLPLGARGGESPAGPVKLILRRQLKRTKGHLPPHLASLALWSSGGSRNVLSAVVEAR